MRRIYRMCVKDGLGARVIGQRLMADGVPAANNAKRWWDGQVYRVLEQRDLQGHLVVRQGPLHLDGGRDTGPREGQGHVDTGAVPRNSDEQTWTQPRAS